MPPLRGQCPSGPSGRVRTVTGQSVRALLLADLTAEVDALRGYFAPQTGTNALVRVPVVGYQLHVWTFSPYGELVAREVTDIARSGLTPDRKRAQIAEVLQLVSAPGTTTN